MSALTTDKICNQREKGKGKEMKENKSQTH
jgi:hypothetical protein